MALKKHTPHAFKERLKLSWSNWGFGMEPLNVSAKRLHEAGVSYIELHGNHYGADLGYRAEEVRAVLEQYDLKVSGVCGMFSAENDLSSNRAKHRQAALDYLKREIAFTSDIGGEYLLVVPGAVGRPDPYDDTEFERSVETLQLIADQFQQHHVKAAVEPIRKSEVSLVHTIDDAQHFIRAVNHAGVSHINADVYHMLQEEEHIASALLSAGEALINVHMADSHRGALGTGSMDIDTIIMALYILGFNQDNKYVTFEPLGPGGDPYPAMFSKPDPALLDQLVATSITYFREREEILLSQK